MQNRALTLAVLVTSLVPAGAFAYSFAGSDWLYSATGQSVVTISPAFGGGSQTQPINESNIPIVVSQTSANLFTFPYSLGPFAGTGDFAVTGLNVSDTNAAGVSAPFVANGFTFRVSYPAFTTTGVITGINTNVNGAFGARAFQVTGNPFNIPNSTLQAQVGNFWVPAGTVNTTITAWSMNRPNGNPVVTGTLDFGQLGANPVYVGILPSSIPVSVRNSANVEVVTSTGTLDPVTGAFSVSLPLGSPNPFRISFKLNPWLRRTFPAPTSPAFSFVNQNLGTVVLVSGDFDDDNAITPSDYGVWAINNGSEGGGAMGDADGDGSITPSDYGIWAQNNGQQGDD